MLGLIVVVVLFCGCLGGGVVALVVIARTYASSLATPTDQLSPKDKPEKDKLVAGEAGDKIVLTLDGPKIPDEPLTLTALVVKPEPGEIVVLTQLKGLKRLDGSAIQAVPPKSGLVTWRLQAEAEGTYLVEVRSNKGASQKLQVVIRSKSGAN